MNPEYEKKVNSLGIRKSHEIQIIVREYTSRHNPQKGAILWSNTSKGYGTMHAVIKAIYEALPDYKGKRLDIEVLNKTAGLSVSCWEHCVPLNRIPRQL